MLALAGLLIVLNAVIGLFEQHELKSLDWGLAIIATAGLVNFMLGTWAQSVQPKHSLPLEPLANTFRPMATLLQVCWWA